MKDIKLCFYFLFIKLYFELQKLKWHKSKFHLKPIIGF